MILLSWPRWIARATSAWAVTYAALMSLRVLGVPVPPGGRALAVGLGLAALGAAVLAATSVRDRSPGRWRTAALSACVASCLVGSFGIVIQLVATVGTGTVDSWPHFLHSLWCAFGGILFLGTTVAYRRRSRDLCPLCGQSHVDAVVARTRPEPTPPSRAVRWTAYAGAAAFLPYVAVKTLWAFGVDVGGLAGPDLRGDNLTGMLAAYGIDITALFAILGAILNVALVQRWGQVFPRWVPFLAGRGVPRWIPLTPAWLGAASLGPYGVFMVPLTFLLALGVIDVDAEGMVWFLAVAALGFGGFGVTTGIAALSYQRRTRPVCVLLDNAAWSR